MLHHCAMVHPCAMLHHCAMVHPYASTTNLRSLVPLVLFHERVIQFTVVRVISGTNIHYHNQYSVNTVVWQGDGEKQVLTITVPLLVAADPRQRGGEGTEHVVECPGDDYIVIQRTKERYGYHTNSKT